MIRKVVDSGLLRVKSVSSGANMKYIKIVVSRDILINLLRFLTRIVNRLMLYTRLYQVGNSVGNCLERSVIRKIPKVGNSKGRLFQ